MTESALPFPALAAQGLNLQAVFNLDELPAEIIDSLGLSDEARRDYTQLLLIGHRGQRMWEAVQQRGMHGAHPIDAFSREQTEALFASSGPLAGHRCRIVFPGPQPVGLRRLGELAGWHHDSPFRVGVNSAWGSWFAYRAVALTDTALATTPRLDLGSPCDSCAGRPCVSACPAGALNGDLGGDFDMKACLSHRKQPQSSCLDRCLARNACPAGTGQRYTEAEIRYHYLQSMPAIRRYY